MLSYLPEIISIVVSYSNPKYTYGVNKVWSELTYKQISPKMKQFYFDKAVNQGHTNLVQRLIREVDPTRSMEDAITYNHLEVVKVLLDDSRVDPDQVVGEEYSPLMLASSQGNAGIVKLLLTKCEPNIQDSQGYTALMMACYENKVEAIKVLLDDPRIDVNVKDMDYLTAAFHCIEGDSLEALKLMLDDPRVRAGFNRKKALSHCYDRDIRNLISNM